MKGKGYKVTVMFPNKLIIYCTWNIVHYFVCTFQAINTGLGYITWGQGDTSYVIYGLIKSGFLLWKLSLILRRYFFTAGGLHCLNPRDIPSYYYGQVKNKPLMNCLSLITTRECGAYKGTIVAGKETEKGKSLFWIVWSTCLSELSICV